jgi:hypothetical protein
MPRKDCVPIEPPKRLKFDKMSRWEQFLTWALKPVMYLAQGMLCERAQTAGLFSRRRFEEDEWQADCENSVTVTSDQVVDKQYWLGIFPKPRLFRKRPFVVLRPCCNRRKWYLGRKRPDGTVIVHAVPIYGPVRVITRESMCSYIAFTHIGHQISIEKIGDGVVGQAGIYAKLPLL